MKQKYFSLNLFWDFFKQIKLTGIILTAVLCIITAVPTLAQYITNGRYINEAVQISQVTPVLYFVIYFIPIIYTAGIFKFLNKRRDSVFTQFAPYTPVHVFFRLSGLLLLEPHNNHINGAYRLSEPYYMQSELSGCLYRLFNSLQRRCRPYYNGLRLHSAQRHRHSASRIVPYIDYNVPAPFNTYPD